MHLVHLTASTMFGGPERQMLGMAAALPTNYQTTFLSFSEHGRCQPFLDLVRARGFAGNSLTNDFPRLLATLRELTNQLIAIRADVVLAHGYKANILGRIAARRAGIPIVSVSRGWTGENRKVRLYERLDRWHLRFVDHVVAVSDAQAAKVRAAGVPSERLSVIRNSARFEAFDNREAAALLQYFPIAPRRIVVSAGRLSPEKGFRLLVQSACRVLASMPDVGFIHFGDGVERAAIEQEIREQALTDRFVLAGFSPSLDRLIPCADLVVLPSYTEGMPNILLEAGAAGVACVATRVGGTPEVVVDGQTGLLVPPGNPSRIADAILELLDNDERRAAMGIAARERMYQHFSFTAQAHAYQDLLAQLVSGTESQQCLPGFSNRTFDTMRRTPSTTPTIGVVPSVSVSSSTI